MYDTTIWTPTSVAKPPKGAAVVWIGRDGWQVDGTYYGHGIWLPVDATHPVAYSPAFWRLRR
jgi:hypothetical protein